jgi:hypothetical protein
MVLMLEAMGMKRLIKYNAMPTTIKAITMLIKGIFCSSWTKQAIHDPNLGRPQTLFPFPLHTPQVFGSRPRAVM